MSHVDCFLFFLFRNFTLGRVIVSEKYRSSGRPSIHCDMSPLIILMYVCMENDEMYMNYILIPMSPVSTPPPQCMATCY